MASCLGLAAAFVALRGLVRWRANAEAVGPIRWVEGAAGWGLGRFIAGVAMIAALIYLLGKVDFYLLAPAAILVFGLAFRSDPLAKALRSALIAALFIVAFLALISRIFGIVFP